ELGFATYEALFAEATGIDVAAAVAEAEATLKATEDAYRDLLAYTLRKLAIRVDLRPRGEGAVHDLARAGRLEPLDDVFPDRRLRSTVEGLLADIGLSPDAGGRIDVDFEPRAAKTASGAFAPNVPHEVLLVRGPESGAGGFRAFFRALARAQAFAGANPDAFFEERRLIDPALPGCWGVLFEHLLQDPRFLKRALDVDPRDGLEAARMLAVMELAELRRECAQLAFERTLYAEGPRAELAGLYRERMQKAMLLEWPVERWLFDVEPRFATLRRLRGRALEALVSRRVLEEADEDYWRNPRFGALLRSWFSKSCALDADAFAKSLGGALDLHAAAQRIIRVAAA
ncbi:MAG: hypothetical protein ACK4N5_13960, partial [Myxococcales bacterium]